MNGNLSDEQRGNLHRIKKISTLIGDSYDVKIFNQHCLAVEEALENYDLSMKVMKIKTKQLERLFSSTNTASYPFKVLRDDGAHFG
jgi:hypothetical protein